MNLIMTICQSMQLTGRQQDGVYTHPFDIRGIPHNLCSVPRAQRRHRGRLDGLLGLWACCPLGARYLYFLLDSPE